MSASDIRETWSALCGADLGLKAAFWADDKRTQVICRDIVAWFTYHGETGENGVAPMVLSDRFYPVLVTNVPGYAGVFPKTMEPDEVIAIIKSWYPSPTPTVATQN